METLITKLGEQGVVALILALSISGNVWFIRLIIEGYEKRLNDVKEHRDVTIKLLESIKSTVDTTLSGLQGIVANNNK